MSTKLLITFAIILLILGCQNQTVSFTEGLLVRFEEDNPPNDFFSNEKVDLTVRIKNQGSYTLEAGDINVKLVGEASTKIFNPSVIEARNDDAANSIEEGSREIKVDLGSITYTPERMVERYATNIEADVCYDYETQAVTAIYIGDSSSYVKKGRLTIADNSKAPVIAQDLKERAGRDVVNFEFLVEKRGKGEIVSDCDSGDKGMVTVDIIHPAGISCSSFNGNSEGTLELEEGQEKVYCAIPFILGNNYPEQLQIILRYTYLQHLSKRVVIEKP